MFSKPAVRYLSIAIVMIGAVVTFLEHQKVKLPPEEIRMADASQPVFALVYIAEKMGYFSDENLNVVYDSYTSGRDALNSVISGKNDVATVYETPVVLKTYEGEKLSIISELHNSTKNTALVARLDRGIKQPKDLVGKKIAVTLNTNANFFLNQFLSSHAVEKSSVTIVPTKPQDMEEALKSGAVDAVAVWNPYLRRAQLALPKHMQTTFYSNVYTELSVLVLKQSNVPKKKEAISRLLAALVRAEKYMKNNPRESIDMVMTRMPDNVKGITRDVLKDVKIELRLSNILTTILHEEASWFRQEGKFSDPVPDFNSIIATKYLREIQPTSVTVR